jgi:hypothetical protein
MNITTGSIVEVSSSRYIVVGWCSNGEHLVVLPVGWEKAGSKSGQYDVIDSSDITKVVETVPN